MKIILIEKDTGGIKKTVEEFTYLHLKSTRYSYEDKKYVLWKLLDWL